MVFSKGQRPSLTPIQNDVEIPGSMQAVNFFLPAINRWRRTLHRRGGWFIDRFLHYLKTLFQLRVLYGFEWNGNMTMTVLEVETEIKVTCWKVGEGLNFKWMDLIVAYVGVSISFRTGLLERELQMVQLSATRWNCIAILRVSLVSFAAITLCVASQLVFVV